ncbi:MAG: hypothetical protein ABR567_10555 [Myxococcales bacterium]|nr:hypothetical protein [Myxococcales bacterium]
MKAQKSEGAVALVTGANRGIGRALTEALLSRGARKVGLLGGGTNNQNKEKNR